MNSILIELQHTLSIGASGFLEAPGGIIVEVELVGCCNVATIWLSLEEKALLHIWIRSEGLLDRVIARVRQLLNLSSDKVLSCVLVHLSWMYKSIINDYDIHNNVFIGKAKSLTLKDS